MRHGSLFSGIGGFDLAAEWMGWENVFHCEWMEFPRKVLDYHFPNADSHIDICKTDFTKYANKIDILTGGFPCQPFSTAGKRKGTEDERYLWGEMLRAIQEIKPKFVIAENVFGITNIDGGLVFQQVCVDLENEGYEVQPFIIPAAAKNAPHRRDRCWFIAYSNYTGRSTRFEQIQNENGEISKWNNNAKFSNTNASNNWDQFPAQSPFCKRDDGLSDKLLNFVVDEFYDTNSHTSQKNRIKNLPEVQKRIFSEEIWQKIRGLYSLESKTVLLKTMQLYTTRKNSQIKLSPFSEEFCRPIMQHLQKYGEFRCSPQGQELQKQRDNQFGNSLSFLPHEVALAAKRFETAITKFENWHTKESIKGYGNAIVPQVAYEIFKAIHQGLD